MNRPTPISLHSDQRQTKSTTRSRTSCGTQTWVRAPQDFFLKRYAQPLARPRLRPWSGSSFPETRCVAVRRDGSGGPCSGRQQRRSRRTLFASGRIPSAAAPVPHTGPKLALYPISAASGSRPSRPTCSAFVLFACALSVSHLNGRTLSPVPAEATHYDDFARFCRDLFIIRRKHQGASISVRIHRRTCDVNTQPM